jgi:DNA-binding Lrp family transcriptional regulator
MFVITARRPRFRRNPKECPPLRLTARDAEILRQVAAHRFLRSSQIAELAGGSKQQILRRLQLLFHHGYLERPRAQLDYYDRAGSKPIVYGLGSRGAAHLRREFDIPFERMDWSRKNQEVRKVFLDHALLVSEVMVSLELACRKRPDVTLIPGDTLSLPPEAIAEEGRDPFQWRVSLGGSGKHGVVPDKVFALEFPATGGSETQRAYYFLEADRGTMPVIRDGLEQSSFYRKLLAYEATWSQDIHRKRFGFHRFRVLTVTTSAPRVENLIAACEQLERGRGLFLFTDIDSFREAGDVLTLDCKDGNGAHNALLPWS